MVWVCEYFGNKIAMLDPDSGKVTEYDLPLKYGNPYDLWPDAEGNIWVENAVYNSLVKFEPATKKWTYYPFPELGAHTPKLDRDKAATSGSRSAGRPASPRFARRANAQVGRRRGYSVDVSSHESVIRLSIVQL